MGFSRFLAALAVLVGLTVTAGTAKAEAVRTELNYAYSELFAHLPGGTDKCGFVHGFVYVYDRLTTKGNNAPVPYQWVSVLLNVHYCDKPIVQYHGSALLTAADHAVTITKGGANSAMWSAWLKRAGLKLWNKDAPTDIIWLDLDLQWAGQDIFNYYGSHTKVAGVITSNAQTDWCPAKLTGSMTGTGSAVGGLTFVLAKQLRTRIVDTEATVHN